MLELSNFKRAPKIEFSTGRQKVGKEPSLKQHQLAVFEYYFLATLHLNISSTVAKWDL
jgi:hypothetical protein